MTQNKKYKKQKKRKEKKDEQAICNLFTFSFLVKLQNSLLNTYNK